MDSNSVYRFRSTKKLLGEFEELQKQYIYFASPEELNDPLEGHLNVFWEGDEIVWKKFIINYTKSLMHLCTIWLMVDESKQIDEGDILVLMDYKGQSLFSNNKLVDEVVKKLFQNNFFKNLPKELASRKSISRFELVSYLYYMHPIMVGSINEVFEEYMFNSLPLMKLQVNSYLKILENLRMMIWGLNKLDAGNSNNYNSVEGFFSVINSFTQEQALKAKYYLNTKGVKSENAHFIRFEFPEKYISKLEESIYPKWYSASFLSKYENSMLWAHYADNHKGVCLIFKPTIKDEKPILKIKRTYGASNAGPMIGMVEHELKKVIYDSNHVELNFFTSLAKLNTQELKVFWYTDEKGNLSRYFDHLKDDNLGDKWRESHWNNFEKMTVTKMPDWNKEDEYRLILDGDFHNYSAKESRKLEYDFEDLEGIIFGIKTSMADKIETIKIIREKCNLINRTNFDFFQANFSKTGKNIQITKLHSIK